MAEYFNVNVVIIITRNVYRYKRKEVQQNEKGDISAPTSGTFKSRPFTSEMNTHSQNVIIRIKKVLFPVGCHQCSALPEPTLAENRGNEKDKDKLTKSGLVFPGIKVLPMRAMAWYRWGELLSCPPNMTRVSASSLTPARWKCAVSPCTGCLPTGISPYTAGTHCMDELITRTSYLTRGVIRDESNVCVDLPGWLCRVELAGHRTPALRQRLGVNLEK